MKYYATFNANNGSTYSSTAYEYTNKQKAIADIKSIVAAEHFKQTGNRSTYSVTDETGQEVAAGTLHGFGRWSVDNV